MARLVKFLLVLIAAFIGVGVVASIALFLFFDPNDFRDNISAAVKKATGRELVIEGDLSLSIFPWIAVEIGHTRLGNAEGFGDEPFLSFDAARLSVRLIPLIVRQEVAVGTASLAAMTINLAVNRNGVSNWDDLAGAGEKEPASDVPETPATGGSPLKLDIANVEVSDANVRFVDAQAGSSASISNLAFSTGRIAAGTPFDIAAHFEFDTQPDGIGGALDISGTLLFSEDFGQIDVDGLNVSGDLRGITDEPTNFNFDSRAISVDTNAQNISLGELDMGIFGIGLTAKVEPFSYAGEPQPVAEIQVREFSLKEIMQTFGAAPPETADPNAMQRVSFSAKAAVRKNDIALSNVQMVLDDTNMDGSLSLPKTADGALKFDLHVDSIVVDHYMAPAAEETVVDSGGSDANVEIPVDLIRALNVEGSFRMDKATLGGMAFEDMQLGVNGKDGNLRLYPIAARMFDGEYKGDVRIDARGDKPTITVDENIVGVQLSSLASAMYGVENVSGTINGRFQLSGSGADINTIREDLDGRLNFELQDGEFQGTDVWYELRNARALLKQETPPEPRLPPRTEFTSVLLAGTVTNGVMMTEELLAELPFLRLSGDGAVSFVDASIDASVEARVVERPEFAGQISEDELRDFTSAVIPMRISGPLASPSIKPDIEALLRREVERQVEEKTEELKDRLIKSLLGGDEPPAEGEEGEEEATEEEEEQDPEDLIKDALKDIFGD